MSGPDKRQWAIAPGEEARLTPEGPTSALIESRGLLPLRARSESSGASRRPHPGSAVVLGAVTYEVVAEEAGRDACVYRLERWPSDHMVRDRIVYGPRLVRAAQEERRRNSRERWAGPALRLAGLILECGAALLPAAERRAAAERLSLDPMRGTWLLVALQLFGGSVLWAFDFVTAGQARLEAVAGQYTKAGSAPSDREIAAVYAPFKGGSASWSPEGLRVLGYALTAQGLVLEYAILTGLVRGLNAVATRQPLGDPLLSLALGAFRGGRARRRERERLARQGPERPDRLLEDGEDLIVLAAREKPDWDERATIGIGERFYRVRGPTERPDEGWQVLAYRLTPVEAGSMLRGLVRYEPPEKAGRRPRPSPVSSPPVPGPAVGAPPMEGRQRVAEPAKDARPKREDASRAGERWRVDEGEEARLTPAGPRAAVIESLGSLPLRLRSEALGVHHRPEFPGTCVSLGGARYEVVEEQPLETGFRYLLEPWAGEAIFRDVVEYGPKLVRAAQRERERALERERASRWSSILYPLVGLLPEERQVLACDRLGLDPSLSTYGGVGLELGIAIMLALSLPAGSPMGPAYVIAGLIVAPALYRLLGAVLFREVSGSPLLRAGFALWDSLGRSGRRADATVLPLTREAFWARLARPDRHDRQTDGSVIVRSLMPHLSWGRALGTAPVLRVGGDHWRVATLPTVLEQGRLAYAYQLWPLREPEMLSDLPDPVPPDPRHYQAEVLEQVAKEWDDVFGVAPWLPALLPRAAQERAYRGRGGPSASQRWSVLTALTALGLALWFLLGKGTVNLLTGVVCGFDGAQRLLRTLDGKYAPSLLGLAVSDYLRPERVAYHAHLEAERISLRALDRTR